MNPLNRKMFRQPGMSRQPMGILASSPELANVAAQRQPVRMAQGGSSTYMAAIQSLAQQGDVQTLMEIVRGNAPRDVKVAAQEAVNALSSRKEPAQISTAPRVQTAGSLASPPVMSVRGSGDTISLKAEPPMMSYDGPSEGALQRRAALTDAPSKITEGLSSGLDKVGIGLTDVGKKIISAFDASQGVGTYKSPAETQAEVKARLDKFLNFRGFLRPDPSTTESVVASPVIEPVPDMPSEGLVKDRTPASMEDYLITGVAATTPTQDEAATDAGASTDNLFDVNKKKAIGAKAGSTTATKAINTISEKLTALLSGDVKDSNVMKTTVPASQANNPDAAEAFAETYIAYSDPAEVDLAKVDDAIDQMFGDKKDFTKAKKDAFWMNLMKAGLAIAAGESSNAMTNIAKGLSFGLEGYGKDIKDFNEQEREDEKERRATRFQMIRDERTANIAMAANKNQWSAAQNTLKQNRDQFNTELDYRKTKDASDMAFARQSLAINLIPKIAQLEISGKTLDEQIRSNMATEALNELKNEPELLRIGKRFGFFDDKNKPTQKAFDFYGEEFEKIIMDAQLAKTRGTTAKATDEDKLTGAFERLAPGIGPDKSRVLASSAGQSVIKDAGGDINEAAKLMFTNLKPKFAVGQVVEQGGKKFRVTAVDDQGNATAAEEVK